MTLEIPDFLKRPPMTPEEHRKLLQRSKRWGKRSLFGEGAAKQRIDDKGRLIPTEPAGREFYDSIRSGERKAERTKEKAKAERKAANKRLLDAIRPKGKIKPSGEGRPNEVTPNETQTTRLDSQRDQETQVMGGDHPGPKDSQAAAAH